MKLSDQYKPVNFYLLLLSTSFCLILLLSTTFCLIQINYFFRQYLNGEKYVFDFSDLQYI